VLIEEYFQQIDAISQSIIVVENELIRDKRSLYIGFIEGKVTFLDGSKLHFVAFVDVKEAIKRYKYSYHYQDNQGKLIFRYDMAPHHGEIITFPHHKHLASGQVTSTEQPNLRKVLLEIESQVSWH